MEDYIEVTKTEWAQIKAIIKGVRDLLTHYEKCPQYPENLTIHRRLLEPLRTAVIDWDGKQKKAET